MASTYTISQTAFDPYVYTAGTENSDTFYGSSYKDEVHAGGGNDFIFGGGGDDLIFGDNGDDVLWGEAGNDTLNGGIGNDFMVGGAGADKFIGGDGFDTVSYASSSLGVTTDMVAGGTTNDALGDTFSGVEKIIGSNYSDVVHGNTFANTLDGGQGDDWLFGHGGEDILIGGSGQDHLNGGNGADLLIGGDGIDTLTGGADPDIFAVSVFNDADHITDFEKGVDKVSFTDLKLKQPFGADGVLELSFGEVGSAIFGPDQNHRPDAIVWDDNNHTLYQVGWQWNSNYDAWVVSQSTDLLHFDSNVQITASDFIL
jgi:Ca2+-binding RTX toxin-like protein